MESLFTPSHVPILKTSRVIIKTFPQKQYKRQLKLKPFTFTAKLTNPAVEIFHNQNNSTPPSTNSFPSPLMDVSAESLSYKSGYLGAVPEKEAADVGGDGIHNAMNYLTKILTAKVYDVAIESPLDYAPKLSEKLGVHVWLKREDLQPVFSFKLRGAYNMMANLTMQQLEMGVIIHQQGTVPKELQFLHKHQWKSVERLGATVVLVGESYEEAQDYAKMRAKNEGLTLIPPFDHPQVIAGQGTIGMEIVRQMPAAPLHAIFVPVGGGGLIAGIAAYVKRVRPEVKVIGVEPYDANAMALSLHHGKRVRRNRVGSFADGVAVEVVGEETFRLCRNLIDGVVLVKRVSICASIKANLKFLTCLRKNRSILEPAGALAIAGAEAYCKYYGVKGENVVAITSGANMNFDRLRFVSQFVAIGRQCKAVLLTCMPQKWRNFRKFNQLVSPLIITEFRCRNDIGKEEPMVLYRHAPLTLVSFNTVLQLREMLERMESNKLPTIDLTNNDLVDEDHLQFLEMILCRFMFLEKAGALGKFLDTFSLRWNINLVHYRAQGEIDANVLVGFQVASFEMDEFKTLADGLGYVYAFETENKALKILYN
ncbi:hypothetical protein Pint_32006 [Pistacia integerrima]|uniref:Uncharacterized protein n=1 Tax=Pistacia integerrima TaxID=434235 RepID=A0ACC0XMD5_9ROSI|nr:hypothetical protein Pint_32006 [Pistacia integerrima]